METIENLLKKLNEEQIKPVLDTEGALLVIAGAGSGKTRVLTSRIAYLVMEKGVSPYNIMAITFTNKAANEMKERLVSIIGDVSGMWVSTIHSMCVKILRADIDALGYDSNFTIYDDTDKDKVLKRIFADKGLEADKFLKSVKNHIANAKNACLYPEEYREQNQDVRFIDEICSVYADYESALNHSNALDFDDLLFKTHELFVKRPDIADYYSNKFKYIHVDEFQDTNTVQFKIIQRLSLTHGNIFVVGDDDRVFIVGAEQR
jgi:DNA helicase-2/ATP-dependent DNA helicase PcrA